MRVRIRAVTWWLVSGLSAGAAGAVAADVVVVSPEPAATPREAGVRIGGGWVESGASRLRHGDTGLLFGAHVSLGTFPLHWIDWSTGVRLWSADIDRSRLGDATSGSISNVSLHADFRAPGFRIGAVRPYVLAGPALQFVNADVPSDESLEDALGGFRIGLDAGGGISGTARGASWRIEGRREFVEDAGNWSVSFGLGWWPQQRAQRRAPRALAASATVAPQVPLVATTAPPAASALEPVVRELIRDNLEMRARVDALQRELAITRAAPVAPTAPPVAAAPAPAPHPASVESDLADLARSLERAAALSPGARVLPAADGFRYLLGEGHAFASSSSRLAPAAQDELRRVAVVLHRFPRTPVSVEGHSDSVGSPSVNLRLSEDRAAAVRAELVGLGIDPARIVAQGYGSTRPLTDNATPEARARNRRVEIRIRPDVPIVSEGRQP